MRNYLCISIDGLQSGMIGAYGNTWIQTPTLDSLACQSALFDRFYASSLDLPKTFAEWWQFPPDHHTLEYHKILLTDDADIFLHTDRANAGWFDEKHRLAPKRRKQPAAEFEETQLFRNMAATADLIKNCANTPFLLWAHFNVFRNHWDFPLSYRQRYQIDEDPDAYPDRTVPEIAAADIDPDVQQSVVEAYAGGVSVLDEALAGLLTFLKEENLSSNLVLLFTSVRGFSLGAHHTIGCHRDLYGENVHLPLMICDPDGTFSGIRSQTLIQPADVWRLLQDNVLPEEPEQIHSMLRIEDRVIVSPDWFVYHKDVRDELYVKPDDRWEVNDVADRCPHILEQFQWSS